MITAEYSDRLDRPVVVVTHMRSGTHLMMDLIRRQFPAFASYKLPGEANDMVYLALDVLTNLKARWGDDRAMQILGRVERPLMKVHWTRPDLEDLREVQGPLADMLDRNGSFIHVVRHPLRVLESMWAWEASEAGQGGAWPDQYWVEKRVDYWVHHTTAWMARANSHLFRFEDVMSDSSVVLDRLEDILEEQAIRRIPLLPAKLRGPWHSRLNRLFSIRPESTEILTEIARKSIEGRLPGFVSEILAIRARGLLEKLEYVER